MPAVRRSSVLAATCAAVVCTAAQVAAAPMPEPAAPVERSRVAAPGDLLGAYQSAIDRLRGFGMDPFLYPSAAAFCSGGTTLGLVPAVAGAIPGPWPRPAVTVPGLDLSAAKAGQTLFTFVPYGIAADDADGAGMRVAWINLSSGRSGFSRLVPLPEILGAAVPGSVPAELRPAAERAVRDFLRTALPPTGVRAVPVDTGSGTVLAAVFGTMNNAGQPCLFLPTVGLTTVP